MLKPERGANAKLAATFLDATHEDTVEPQRSDERCDHRDRADPDRGRRRDDREREGQRHAGSVAGRRAARGRVPAAAVRRAARRRLAAWRSPTSRVAFSA